MNHLFRLILLISPFLFQGQTKVSSLFADHMVLQQQEKVTIWGADKPNTSIDVSASWGSASKVTTNNKGKWLLKLQTPKAGGPFYLTVQGTEKVIIKDVMVGEVWLCSGQSNMEMPMRGYSNQPVIGSNEAILNSKNSNIRVFNIARNVSQVPVNSVKGDWKVALPENTQHFSATAYYFAKKVEAVLNIPIGIIVSSWGGSRIESWMDEETLSDFKDAKEQANSEKLEHRRSTVLFNGMIHPIIGYNFKGVLWYQGESNKGNYLEYPKLMKSMISSWRNQWKLGEFPFYYVQIAPFMYPKNNNKGALLREAQLKASREIPNVGMVVTMDIGSETIIHPQEKEDVGNRLAYWALAESYGVKGIAYKSPMVEKIDYLKDGSVEVTFEDISNGITSFDKEITGFELAGKDKIFYKAKAKTVFRKKNVVILTSDKIKEPIAVRYGFKNYVKGSLFSTSGLPVSSFRSDDW